MSDDLVPVARKAMKNTERSCSPEWPRIGYCFTPTGVDGFVEAWGDWDNPQNCRVYGNLSPEMAERLSAELKRRIDEKTRHWYRR